MTHKLFRKISTLSSILLLTSATSEAVAGTPQVTRPTAHQIILDTGNNGGSGSQLPGIKWTFQETANGSPFIFWTWSATG